MSGKRHIRLASAAALGAAIALAAGGCNSGAPKPAAEKSSVADAARASYVAPGELDQYYLFYSGGHSGQVFVAGVPSLRHIATIPVFTPYPGTGYGFDDESKAMLGKFTWGDVHHPNLSKKEGRYDGRWLFVNDNANNRVARIDLRDFKTKQIFGPIPNSSGNHGSAFVTRNTEYLLVGSRFSVPLPKGRVAPVKDYATQYKGSVTGLKVDPESGEMSMGWQIVTPPFNWDLGSTGRGPSDGWVFWSSYNAERATGKLEVTASQRDRDYAAFVNWKAAEQAVANNQYTDLGGVKVIDPAKVKGVMYLVPLGKSPHGVDVTPDGRYIVGSGKLAPVVTVYDFEKFKEAVEKSDFVGEEDGIPVVRWEAAAIAEVPVGLGPLHTQFDDKGYAYTSLFVESAVAKWKLPPYEAGKKMEEYVVDKIGVHYNIGHLVTSHGDTEAPDGRWLVAMNKLSKGRHLNVGPSQPESSQLIDISGQKMTMIAEAFTEPEPHFAQLVKADLIKPIEVYPKEENKDPNAIFSAEQAKVERKGNKVTVWLYQVRTFFAPDAIEVNQGDVVTVHITNAEQSRDELHGFGVAEYNINVVNDPGETKTVTFVADKPGVFPFYCTNFCSALHQEMQGYLVVNPKKRS
jgi:nitrous-oxide reductase